MPLCAYVYILTNTRNGTLYIGVTKDICARLAEHRLRKDPKSFTSRYSLTRLVHLERYDRITDAIDREKQLKNWKRAWKIALIEAANPGWDDLELDALDL